MRFFHKKYSLGRSPMGEAAGFSLVELLIVLPILVIMAGFVAYLFYFQYWVFNTESAELTITNDARQTLDTINDYVRQSKSVLTSYQSPGPLYTTGAQQLVLQVPSLDSLGQFISSSNDTVAVYLTGTSLYLQVFPVAGTSSRPAITKRLASGICITSTGICSASFAFSYNNATPSSATQVTTTVVISVPVANLLGSQFRTITVTSKAKLRNYVSS